MDSVNIKVSRSGRIPARTLQTRIEPARGGQPASKTIPAEFEPVRPENHRIVSQQQNGGTADEIPRTDPAAAKANPPEQHQGQAASIAKRQAKELEESPPPPAQVEQPPPGSPEKPVRQQAHDPSEIADLLTIWRDEDAELQRPDEWPVQKLRQPPTESAALPKKSALGMEWLRQADHVPVFDCAAANQVHGLQPQVSGAIRSEAAAEQLQCWPRATVAQLNISPPVSSGRVRSEQSSLRSPNHQPHRYTRHAITDTADLRRSSQWPLLSADSIPVFQCGAANQAPIPQSYDPCLPQQVVEDSRSVKGQTAHGARGSRSRETTAAEQLQTQRHFAVPGLGAKYPPKVRQNRVNVAHLESFGRAAANFGFDGPAAKKPQRQYQRPDFLSAWSAQLTQAEQAPAGKGPASQTCPDRSRQQDGNGMDADVFATCVSLQPQRQQASIRVVPASELQPARVAERRDPRLLGPQTSERSEPPVAMEPKPKVPRSTARLQQEPPHSRAQGSGGSEDMSDQTRLPLIAAGRGSTSPSSEASILAAQEPEPEPEPEPESENEEVQFQCARGRPWRQKHGKQKPPPQLVMSQAHMVTAVHLASLYNWKPVLLDLEAASARKVRC